MLNKSEIEALQELIHQEVESLTEDRFTMNGNADIIRNYTNLNDKLDKLWEAIS